MRGLARESTLSRRAAYSLVFRFGPPPRLDCVATPLAGPAEETSVTHRQNWTRCLRDNLVRNRPRKVRDCRDVLFSVAYPEDDQIGIVPFRDAQDRIRGLASFYNALWFRCESSAEGNYIPKSLERGIHLSWFCPFNLMQQGELRVMFLSQIDRVASCRERWGTEIGRVQDAIQFRGGSMSGPGRDAGAYG